MGGLELESILNTPYPISISHHGTACGPCTSLHCPSALTPSLVLPTSLTAPLSRLLPTPIFLNPHLPTAQTVPMPRLVRIVGGANTNPTPDTMPPNAVAETAATNDPTAAYFAYRTTRQKMNIPIYRKDRSSARVRNRAGAWLLSDGLKR